jgi:hypothetical protein
LAAFILAMYFSSYHACSMMDKYVGAFCNKKPMPTGEIALKNAPPQPCAYREYPPGRSPALPLPYLPNHASTPQTCMASQSNHATFPGAHNEGSQVGQNQGAIFNNFYARTGTSLAYILTTSVR